MFLEQMVNDAQGKLCLSYRSESLKLCCTNLQDQSLIPTLATNDYCHLPFHNLVWWANCFEHSVAETTGRQKIDHHGGRAVNNDSRSVWGNRQGRHTRVNVRTAGRTGDHATHRCGARGLGG